jgi:hypothetical protein
VPPIRAAEPTVMLQWWGMQKCQTGRAVVCVDYRFNREEDGEIAGGSEWVWATTKAGGDPSLAETGVTCFSKNSSWVALSQNCSRA